MVAASFLKTPSRVFRNLQTKESASSSVALSINQQNQTIYALTARITKASMYNNQSNVNIAPSHGWVGTRNLKSNRDGIAEFPGERHYIAAFPFGFLPAVTEE